MANLASIYRNQGRWKEAEEFEVGVIEARKRVLTREHPSILISKDSLASIYRHQGRLKEAEELGVRVLAARKRTLGDEYPSTLMSMGSLTSLRQRVGQNPPSVSCRVSLEWSTGKSKYFPLSSSLELD